jgi:Fe-S-cluster containining protein
LTETSAEKKRKNNKHLKKTADVSLPGTIMIDTFYLHMAFENKEGGWSVNLPFLCSKCGVCCTLDDFLTAGEITAKPSEHLEVHAKMKALSEELGRMFETDEAEYDKYITHTPCPFLSGKSCSIYEIRPEGCRRFPNTMFGMLTQDCEALDRFKKQRATLKKGRTAKETYHFTAATIKPAEYTEKQLQACIIKLREVGITKEELSLFSCLNDQSKNNV